MPRYSDDFRASAVIMLQAEGYPDRKGALSKVARYLGVHMTSLNRWYNKMQNPPPLLLATNKKADLQEYLEAEIIAIFNELPDARLDADYREMATAAGIFIDKLNLLRGGATARSEDEITIRIVREDAKHLNG
jgi:transposase-like protein